MQIPLKKSGLTKKSNGQSGFTLTEFMIAAFVLLVLSSAIFSMLTEIQRAGSYQAEVQLVLNSTRIAMQTAERYIRQAGNDPLGSGVAGITIVSAQEIQVRIRYHRIGRAGKSGQGRSGRGYRRFGREHCDSFQ